tara:strand:- start:7179 stop:7568 length:390 start_codon:yes stop_codon:yes gene_type:complete
MAGQPVPSEIKLHRRSRELELCYANGESYRLSGEYLRVHSPSAEVMGHGPGEEVLQSGKLNVGISDIRPVGHYAVQLVFDDGHDTGLYSWEYLYDLCTTYEQRWERYIERLTAAGATRDPQAQVLKLGD